MADEPLVLVGTATPVARVTLNRPDVRNAFNEGLIAELTAAFTTLGARSDLRAIVARLDNAVDLVVSGHTHSAYNCSANTIDVRGSSLSNAVTTVRPTGIPNKVGRLVPVTSS